MKYVRYIIAIILLLVAFGFWVSAIGIYYAHDWGGTPEQPCSRTSC